MIITISREFGSGGRELGKRLSNVLEIPCYDKEIIQMIAEKQGFDEQYVSHISEKNLQAAYPRTIGCRFTMTPHPVTKQAVTIAVEQQKIIKTFAAQGDCIMIGRCADVILLYHKTGVNKRLKNEVRETVLPPPLFHFKLLDDCFSSLSLLPPRHRQ